MGPRLDWPGSAAPRCRSGWTRPALDPPGARLLSAAERGDESCLRKRSRLKSGEKPRAESAGPLEKSSLNPRVRPVPRQSSSETCWSAESSFGLARSLRRDTEHSIVLVPSATRLYTQALGGNQVPSDRALGAGHNLDARRLYLRSDTGRRSRGARGGGRQRRSSGGRNAKGSARSSLRADPGRARGAGSWGRARGRATAPQPKTAPERRSILTKLAPRRARASGSSVIERSVGQQALLFERPAGKRSY